MKKLLYVLLVLLSSASAYSQMLFSENLTMTIDSTKTLQGSLMPILNFKTEKENIFTFKNTSNLNLLIIVLLGEENPKYPIITDGIIQKNVLEDVDKTEEWLLAKLQELGYNSLSEVFLAEYESAQIKVIPYDN